MIVKRSVQAADLGMFYARKMLQEFGTLNVYVSNKAIDKLQTKSTLNRSV